MSIELLEPTDVMAGASTTQGGCRSGYLPVGVYDDDEDELEPDFYDDDDEYDDEYEDDPFDDDAEDEEFDADGDDDDDEL